MGFARRLVRKSVRRATPRTVRKAMHPARTVKNAITPRPIRQASHAIYTVTNPLGAAENAIIGAALNAGSTCRGSSHPRGQSSPSTAGGGTGSQTFRVSGGGVRAAEAVVVHERLAALMAVQRERFTAVTRPAVPEPQRGDPTQIRRTQWVARKHEVPWWRRGQRSRLREEVAVYAEAQVDSQLASATTQAAHEQATADAWWQALNRGEPSVLTSALVAAFADNPAPVTVLLAAGAHAAVAVSLPDISVLPDKRVNITPSGRLSSKAWTKTELHEVYADLLAAHLLAIVREAFAIAPSLATLTVIGMSENGVLFSVDVDRHYARLADDTARTAILAGATHGLRYSGRARAVQPWPATELPNNIAPLVSQWVDSRL